MADRPNTIWVPGLGTANSTHKKVDYSPTYQELNGSAMEFVQMILEHTRDLEEPTITACAQDEENFEFYVSGWKPLTEDEQLLYEIAVETQAEAQATREQNRINGHRDALIAMNQRYGLNIAVPEELTVVDPGTPVRPVYY